MAKCTTPEAWKKFIECETCGEYEVTEELAHWALRGSSILNKENKFVLSGLCRELKETEQEFPCLTAENLSELMSRSMVPDMQDINAKLVKLLAAVKRRSDHFGKIVELSRDNDYPLAYAKNAVEFFAFIDQLVAMKLLELKEEDNRTKFVMLSASCWAHPSNKMDNEESSTEIGFKV